MPNWNSYFSYDTGTASNIGTHTYITATQVQQQYEEYVRERKRQECMIEQMLRDEEEHIREEHLHEKERMEDRNKYPLFFWRETCSKQRKETCK